MMHGPEKSDLAIVAGKPAYKAEQSAAESVERRAGTKGNANQQSTCRTQSRISVSQALERIRPAFASDSVIHPRSPTGRALSDADSASSSTALSLRASGGVDVPGANAALMVFHIPMAGRYVAALQGTPPASLGSLDRGQRENKRNAARRPWSAHRFESRAYPNSSPMPKPIRVRSPWRRASAFVRPSHPP